MRNISEKSCRENQNTLFYVPQLFLKNGAVYEIKWKNKIQPDRLTDDIIIRRMRFALWISMATDTPSEYVILNAFPQQQWLKERVPMLRYMYTACVVG